jgi:hypothetical protein
MSEIWKEEEIKFLKAIENINIPNKFLEKVNFVELKNIEDFDRISIGGGCYWIWTNEPILHCLHKNKIPDKIFDGEIIYNGLAKDDVKGRLKHHLVGEVDAGWSGVSVDIYHDTSNSHRKKALSIQSRSKVPYFDRKPIRNVETLLRLNLSDEEKHFIQTNSANTYYFRNGINIFDKKHSSYTFRVYFITDIISMYAEFIEKNWREKYGMPKLCSYLSGR